MPDMRLGCCCCHGKGSNVAFCTEAVVALGLTCGPALCSGGVPVVCLCALPSLQPEEQEDDPDLPAAREDAARECSVVHVVFKLSAAKTFLEL